jgi:hypothetical protein
MTDLTRTNVQLTADQHATLRRRAFESRRSIADLVREAVDQYLNKEDAIMQYTETTYTRQGTDYPAIQITWTDLRAAGYIGDGSDDMEIAAALLAAGAPTWVATAQGWTDETGYGLYNSESRGSDN